MTDQRPNKIAYSVERRAYRKSFLSANRYPLTALILIECFLFTSLIPIPHSTFRTPHSSALASERNLPSLAAKKTFPQAPGIDLLRQRSAKDGAAREIRETLAAKDGEGKAIDAFLKKYPDMEDAFGRSFIESHWDELVSLGVASGENAWRLFEDDLPALKGTFGMEWVNSHWGELVSLGVASGENAGVLFWNGLPILKEIFGMEWVNSHWNELVSLGVASGENAGVLFWNGLPALKEPFGMEWVNSHWNELVSLGVASGEDTRVLFRYGLPILKEIFGMKWIDQNWNTLKNSLASLLSHTTDYNRGRILQLLLSEDHLSFLKSQEADLLEHLSFYTELLSKEKRLGHQILQGVLEGFREKIVDIHLPITEKDKIFAFIKKFHSFSPPLFSLYKQGGEEAVRELFEFSQRILLDDVDKKEVDQFIEKYQRKGLNGLEVLSSSIQIVLPASGASFVKKEEIRGLLEKFIQEGDLRDHVPSPLRNKDFGEGKKDAISLTEWSLKEGEPFDPEGKIKNLLSQLRTQDQGLKEKEKAKRQLEDKQKLIKTLLHYFRERTPQNKEAVLQALYAYASHNDQLGEKIDRIQPEDYQGLNLLEQLFIDKDNLSVLLREILKEIEPSLFPQGPVALKTIDKPKSLATQLQGIWRSSRTEEDKQTLVQRMLQDTDPEEIQSKLLPLLEDQALRHLVLGISQTPRQSRALSQRGIVEELFQGPVELIQNEKVKFEPKELDRKVILEFRVVKGIPYGLWGMNCGVCIATDLKLWKKPQFFLLAMIDKEQGKVVGFVHLFETEINGKKVLTVPGIEPSVELFSEVRPKAVYPLIEKALVKVAEAGGYEALYAPTDSNILSNRVDIQKEVQKRYGSHVRELPSSIEWNHLPQPYPFDKVYVMWEKSEVTKDGARREMRPAPIRIDRMSVLQGSI